MGGKPASLLADVTSHGSVIVSGSPDTIIEFRPAVRLTDITTPCPPPHPPNKVTKTSKTVFINRLGAARRGDKTTCGGAGAPSMGCSHPAAEGYEVRGEDAYQKLIAVEHEASDWDEVDDYQREALDGKREKPPVPLGAPPSKRKAGRKPGETKKGKSPKSSSAKVASRGDENPLSAKKKGKARKKVNASSLSKSAGPYVPAIQSPGASSGGGGKSGKAVEDTDEDKRKKKKKLDLEFSTDVKMGKRKGSAGYAGMNSIAGPCAMTVIVGD